MRRDGAILHAVLHWQGGDHTELHVKQRLNAAGRHNPRIPDATIALMRELARLMPDRQIARLLNRIGVATGYGNAWTQERVRGFRNHHEIACYRDGQWAERGEISLEAAAKWSGMQYDGGAHASPWRDQGPAGLSRRSLGHQDRRPGRIDRAQAARPSANTKSRSAYL